MSLTVDIEALLAKQPLLIFDGECGFCNRSILFFLKHEKKSYRVNFVSQQSEAGKALIQRFKLEGVDSMILIRNHEAFIKTCVVLRLTVYMRGLWPLLTVFLIIPPFLRNPFYTLIAHYRQKLMGKVEQCALLKEQDQQRFLS